MEEKNYQSLKDRLLINETDVTRDDENNHLKKRGKTSETNPVILILGGTGETGQGVIRCLLRKEAESNKKIRILARNPEAAQKLFGENHHKIEIIKGNVHSLDAIKLAMINVTHVFYLIGPRLQDFHQSLQDCLVTGLRYTLEEGKKLGTLQHIILLSAMGTEWAYHPRMVLFNTVAKGIWVAHIEQERLLRASGLNYTIIRPPRMGSVNIKPEEIMISNKKCERDYISRAAVAEFMSRCIENPDLEEKVTLKMWGTKKILTKDFAWKKLFQTVHSDIENLPLNFEQRHTTAKRVYAGVILVLLATVGFLLVWKYGLK